MSVSDIVEIVGEVGVLVGVLAPVFVSMHKIKEGMKCQLRSEMLQIYYRNMETREIRQYEYENFVSLYEAYKALNGNSFIDKIYKEMRDFTIIP